MKTVIGANTRVVLDYTLRDSDDDVLDASHEDGGEPIVYVHGYGMLVPGLERALAGMSVGESKEIVVAPEEGYGERDEDLVSEVPIDALPRRDVAVGDEFEGESEDGVELTIRVVAVEGDRVVLDGNHPLAGQTLRYTVMIREVRPATEEEIREAASAFEDARAEHETAEPPENLVPLGRKGPRGRR